MKVYTVTGEDMIQDANIVKDAVLQALEREGLLTKKAEEIGQEYAVVMHKRGLLGRFWERFFKPEGSELMITVFRKI